MFQNLSESTIKDTNYEEKNKITLFTNVLSAKNIPIYIITLMMSMIEIPGGFLPFSISIFAACISNSIPLLGVVIASIIGIWIKFGVSSVLTYVLISLILIASMFVIKPVYNDEGKNEKVKISKNIFISTMLVLLVKAGMAGFTTYEILFAISNSVVVLVFYKIFANSITVIQDYSATKAFSIEEVLGASLMLSIAVAAFGNLNIFGFSIRNILSILIVLILGWKNGVLVGTTAGVTIGVTLGVITSSEPAMVAAYAVSGMIAGILNRFGKIGVIIGFCLGNVILAYVANGNTIELIHFREILIASIGLLAVPKSVQINIEEFIGNNKFLPSFGNNTLNRSSETAEKLNNVSETIQEMADSIKPENEENIEENSKSNKDIFITELLDNLQGYENNILYEDIKKTDGPIIDKIFNILLSKQQIDKDDLLNVFAECNSYILGFDDKQTNKYLEENISQMVRVINMSYKISKTNFVWQKKLEENKKNTKEQLNGVSKAISNLANNLAKNGEDKYLTEKEEIAKLLKAKEIEIQDLSIEKNGRFFVNVFMEKSNNTDIKYIENTLTNVLKEKMVFNQEASAGTRLRFMSADKYEINISSSGKIKKGNQVSGDSFLSIKLKDGKNLIALSDGMGSGSEARNSSDKALKMMENLLLSGFDKKTSIELINSSLINQNAEIFATLDIAIVDLYEGNIEFIKSGACPSYIKNRKNVQIIKSNSLPVGIINQNNVEIFDRDIKNNDILVMCSDGIIDSNVEYKNKELWVKYLLEDIETMDENKITELILNESMDNSFGVAKDDMSVVVCRFLTKA